MEKKRVKRAISSILVSSMLAVTVLTSAASAETVEGSLENFKKGTAKEFSDVVSTDWYYSNVADAAALGIIQGNPDGTFNPNGNLSVAEALTLASRVNAIFYQRTEDLNRDSQSNVHWADGILNYAEKNGNVSEGYSGNLDNVCTRVQMADMFAKSVSADSFTEINNMELAPAETASESIATLFKAGVLVGDSNGFRENGSVTRAESAAIINRVVMPAQRITVTEKNTEVSDEECYYVKIAQPSVMASTHELWDSTLTVKGPNGEDSIKLSEENKLDTGGWLLKFNIGKFAEGDEITITHTGDPTISYADSDNNNQALAPFKVMTVDDGYLGDNNEWVEDIRLQGTESSPKTIWILKDFKGEARISFKDMNGKALENVKVKLVSFSGMIEKEYTTDAEGKIFVKASEFDDSAKVYFSDGDYAFYKGKKEDGTISTSNFGVISKIQPGVYREFVVCKK